MKATESGEGEFAIAPCGTTLAREINCNDTSQAVFYRDTERPASETHKKTSRRQISAARFLI